ncbi:MAG: CapA family protein [Actinomycetota bacterium]
MGTGFTLALAGDTMLGRGVGERIAQASARDLFAPEVLELTNSADLFVVNLECCISERGEPWPDPAKPFFFRAPPRAVEVLQSLGVGCVTLANNHALDYGYVALMDTLEWLTEAGIEWVGAGPDESRARAPAVLERAGLRVGVVAATDHPAEYAATPDRAGVAYAEFRADVPDWIAAAVTAVDAERVLVTPHWGPNMTTEPPGYVRRAGEKLLAVGADLVAGHSAHVFHGVAPRLIYDLGDFVDDYAVDPFLRNDLGLLWFVTWDASSLRIEAIPLKLDYCHTGLAQDEDRAWIARRFREACAALGCRVEDREGRLVVAS